MDSPPNHPSFLELDRVRLGAASPQTSSHLESCERCQAHLRTLEAPAPLPTWARELKEAPRSRWRFWEGWKLPIAGLAPVAFAAILVAVAVGHWHRPIEPQEETPDLGDKGVPSLLLRVELGDGVVKDYDPASHLSLAPGDRVQLEVNGEGFQFIQVVTGHGEKIQVLYAGPLKTNDATLLPTSWKLDAEPGDEELEVVMSHQPLTKVDVSSALTSQQQDSKVWTRTIVIRKSASRQGTP